MRGLTPEKVVPHMPAEESSSAGGVSMVTIDCTPITIDLKPCFFSFFLNLFFGIDFILINYIYLLFHLDLFKACFFVCVCFVVKHLRSKILLDLKHFFFI